MLLTPFTNQPSLRFKNLRERQLIPCLALQVVIEFWNVATRPISANGFGWNVQDVAGYLLELLDSVELLDGDGVVAYIWFYLASTRRIQGKQVHDARLVATMLAHEVRYLLTL